MKLFRLASSSTAGLISIVLLYILLIVLILVFSNQILTDVAFGGPFTHFYIIPIAIVLPLFLLVSIIINLIKLLKQRRAQNPGARIKIRLLMFFAFITLLSSIPQGILSINFIDNTMKSWFSSRFGSALEVGLSIALSYYNDRLDNLMTITESPVMDILARDIPGKPERFWENIRTINPSIKFCQIFSEDGNTLYFAGDSLGRLDTLPETYLSEGKVAEIQPGMMPKESKKEVTVLRTIFSHLSGTGSYTIIAGTVLQAGFDKGAQELTTAIELFKQLERFRSLFRGILILFYSFFSLPIIFLSLLISFLLSEEIIRPIVHLEEATKRIAEGDFSIRIFSRSRDEMSILISSFNKMVSELDRSRKKIAQTEKVTAWQEIAQRLAHEIKNPLTPIKLSAQRILHRFNEEPASVHEILAPSLNSIIEEVDNINTLLQEFRNFARMPVPNREQVLLKPIMEAAASLYAASYPQVRIQLDDVDGDISLSLDRNLIKQVFTNMFQNSLEAIEGAGAIIVRTDIVTKGKVKYCRIQIKDTGAGISPGDQEKIFNPYFTTKTKGTGLGLAIVERILFDHNGQIWFESVKGAGTVFFIDLPKEENYG
ncbi:MAG: HAMP domain-containing protein [Spirochaetales bacterium]|nr:MAG: HAMP domain-containing protein [Spirochaetales bacterium]